jgi:hypothetical protein
MGHRIRRVVVLETDPESRRESNAGPNGARARAGARCSLVIGMTAPTAPKAKLAQLSLEFVVREQSNQASSFGTGYQSWAASSRVASGSSVAMSSSSSPGSRLS